MHTHIITVMRIMHMHDRRYNNNNNNNNSSVS